MLKGKNISLRALEPEDLEFLYLTENNASLWHVSDSTMPYSKDLLKKYLENSHQDLLEAGQYRFVIEHENEPVGLVDLYSYESRNRKAGVGILISKNQDRGKGWGTEALVLLQNYAKEVWNVHQLYAHIEIENRPSIVAFKKAGFNVVATLKDWHFAKGKFHDVQVLQWL